MIRKVIVTSAIVFSLFLPFVPGTVFAYSPTNNVCDNPVAQASSFCQDGGDTSNNPLTGQKGLIRGIANILAFVTGLGAVITIIVAGLRLITAHGDANTVKTARAAIIAALVGIMIILLAETIIGLVLGRIS